MSPPTTLTYGPPSGWRSTWKNSRVRSWLYLMTAIFWIPWWTGSSRSKRERRSFILETIPSTRWKRSGAMRSSSGSMRRSRPRSSSWRRLPSSCVSGPIRATTRYSNGPSPWRSASSGCVPPTAPRRSGKWRSALGNGSFEGMRCCPSKGWKSPLGSEGCFLM